MICRRHPKHYYFNGKSILDIFYAFYSFTSSSLLHMIDITISGFDPLLDCSICDQFELASRAKVNLSKSEAMLFGNWPDWSSVPFTLRSNYLLGIRFRGAGMGGKYWLERIAKLLQILGIWEQFPLPMAGKNLVIRLSRCCCMWCRCGPYPVHAMWHSPMPSAILPGDPEWIASNKF